jgi:uncharacterized protein (TIGR04222 family)
MTWLLHNPIADMHGPHFLIFYAATIAVVIASVAVFIRRYDQTRGIAPPPLPKKPDPIEVAYLRGGANEVTRLIVFDLVRRGYLQISGDAAKAEIDRADVRPPVPLTTPLEKLVFSYFATPRDARALFRPGGLAAEIEEQCEEIRWRLHDEQLLNPSEHYRTALLVGLFAAFTILGLGGYKLAVALTKGHTHVQFLIVMAVIGLIFLAIACCVPRLSSRGRAYLDRLSDAFEGLKARAEAPASTRPDPVLLLVPALFGMTALIGTSYQDVAQMFRRSTASGGGCGGGCGAGCGGGCGGGGCGGGGCGGGCGGCGG